MELKNAVKTIFRMLKDDAKIDYLFNECNRQLVLGISAGDKHPRIGTLDSDLKYMAELRPGLTTHPSMVDDDSFVRKFIGDDTVYRYTHISMPSQRIELDYFVVSENSKSPDIAGNTSISSILDDGEPKVFAIMVLNEEHPSVSDDTFGKIVKHELTHVLLEMIQWVLHIPVFTDADDDTVGLIEDDKELYEFEEFLCDYIQWDSTVSPGEDPIEKFEEAMKKYLTWLAVDVYTLYLEAIQEYYLEANRPKPDESEEE